MNNKEQEAHLKEEIERVIDRFRLEYEVTYATVFGIFEIIKHEMIHEIDDENENNW